MRRGGRDGKPTLAPFPINDYGTGVMGAYAVSLALNERNRTGQNSGYALFNLDTAIGVQMDQIGTIVGIARESRTDDEYRIILRTQALLVLPERRTQARLMEVIRSLMDDDPGAIAYEQIPPKTFKLVVSTAEVATLISWVPILRRMRPASYVGLLGWSKDSHITYGDTVPEAGPMPWHGYGDASGTVAETYHGYGARIPF